MIGQKESLMRERREARRVDTAIPLTITLLGTPLSPPRIIVETGDISPQGLSVVIKIKTRLEQGCRVIEGGENSKKMVKYLLLDNKQLALRINIPTQRWEHTRDWQGAVVLQKCARGMLLCEGRGIDRRDGQWASGTVVGIPQGVIPIPGKP
jgi:hypothetical protein